MKRRQRYLALGLIVVGVLWLCAKYWTAPELAGATQKPFASWSSATINDVAPAPEPQAEKSAPEIATAANSQSAQAPEPVTEASATIPVTENAPVIANERPFAPNDTADAQMEVRLVRRMIHDYHTLMGQNPVGTNAEIMKTVMGGNDRQAALGPPEGVSLNGNGELVDRWQTPYFFHQISQDVMEIRSAGPDKILGTADDIVTR